jgi:hypothetical protein
MVIVVGEEVDGSGCAFVEIVDTPGDTEQPNRSMPAKRMTDTRIVGYWYLCINLSISDFTAIGVECYKKSNGFHVSFSTGVLQGE